MKKNILLFMTICSMTIVFVTGCSGNDAKVSLGEYLNLDVEYIEKKVNDKDIDNAIIDEIVADNEIVKITKRAVRNGDTANIDFLGKIDGVAFENGAGEGYDLEIGSGDFIDGFEEQVIGMKIGQKKDITVTFPDPYKNNPDLAGAKAVFTVTVNSIEGKEIPTKITNAMIKKISDKYSTVKDYRAYVKEQLEIATEEANKKSMQDAVWKLVVSGSTIESLSNKKIKYYSSLHDSNYQYWADSYGVDLVTLIEEYMGITVAEYNADKKASAEDTAKESAIVEAIANKENLSVSNDEYNTYLEENSVSDENIKIYGESIKDELLYQKVVEFIASKTNFTAV